MSTHRRGCWMLHNWTRNRQPAPLPTRHPPGANHHINLEIQVHVSPECSLLPCRWGGRLLLTLISRAGRGGARRGRRGTEAPAAPPAAPALRRASAFARSWPWHWTWQWAGRGARGACSCLHRPAPAAPRGRPTTPYACRDQSISFQLLMFIGRYDQYTWIQISIGYFSFEVSVFMKK